MSRRRGSAEEDRESDPGERPWFYYTIDSLRIDGDHSADPFDYQRRPTDAVLGRELVAFLRGHLDSRLAPRGERGRPPRPGMRGSGMEWTLDHGVVVAYRPTRSDLEKWSRVDWLTIDVCGPGAILPHRELELDPVRLAATIRERMRRRTT